MTLRLFAHARPADVLPETFIGATVVVIDVLRATTTMATALANDAREIVACASIDQAREKAAELQRAARLACQAGNQSDVKCDDMILTGGERKGVRIDGFDLGNSPKDYTPQRIGGKTIVFTTTNGTVALHHAHRAKRVLIGALVNRAAVAHEIAQFSGEVHLLCAGTGGQPSVDDCITAGAIADAVAEAHDGIVLDDTAALYRTAWRSVSDVAETLRNSAAGRNLLDVCLDGDIESCVRIDTLTIVGEMRGGRVTPTAATRTISL